MTNTHEARHEVTIKAALDLGLQAWRTTGSRERFIEAHDAVNALAADLSVARAQVERMRETLEAVARAHHATIAPSKLHNPEHVRFDRCQAKTCRLAHAALAAAVPDPDGRQPVAPGKRVGLESTHGEVRQAMSEGMSGGTYPNRKWPKDEIQHDADLNLRASGGKS